MWASPVSGVGSLRSALPIEIIPVQGSKAYGKSGVAKATPTAPLLMAMGIHNMT